MESKSVYLRLSIHEDCNLHCTYCRPAREMRLSRRRPGLSNEATVDLVRCLADTVPVRKLRLTGGEPLLRPAVVDLTAALRQILPESELCLTTNATRLADLARGLKAAGLDRLNVSLDTADPARYAALTRGGSLDRVYRGLAAAAEAGFAGTKLNAVLLRSLAPEGILALVREASRLAVELRFIELMPISVAAGLHRNEFLSAGEARTLIEAEFGPFRSDEADGESIAATGMLEVDGRPLRLGFIPSVSEPFCSSCDRLRVDSRGRLFACLRNPDWLDLGTPIRAGDLATATRRVRRVLRAKCPPDSVWPGRQMSAIGG